MSKPSHIPVFPDAYLRDNFRLTLEQHGLFFMLMMEAWNDPDCSLPDSEKELAKIAGITPAKFRKISPEVLEKWTRDGGRIFQKRLRKEWEYVQQVRAKRAAAGKIGGASKCKANAKQMESTYGGGEGGGVPYQGISISDEVSDKPFRIVGGGK